MYRFTNDATDRSARSRTRSGSTLSMSVMRSNGVSINAIPAAKIASVASANRR